MRHYLSNKVFNTKLKRAYNMNTSELAFGQAVHNLWLYNNTTVEQDRVLDAVKMSMFEENLSCIEPHLLSEVE